MADNTHIPPLIELPRGVPLTEWTSRAAIALAEKEMQMAEKQVGYPGTASQMIHAQLAAQNVLFGKQITARTAKMLAETAKLCVEAASASASAGHYNPQPKEGTPVSQALFAAAERLAGLIAKK